MIIHTIGICPSSKYDKILIKMGACMRARVYTVYMHKCMTTCIYDCMYVCMGGMLSVSRYTWVD